MASEDFEDFRARVQGERSVRAQRDAAETQIPGERLRRELREAFAGEDAHEHRDDRQVGGRSDLQSPDAER